MHKRRRVSPRGRREVSGGLFVKDYPNDISTEFEKARMIYEISQISGMFRTPRAVEIDASGTSILFELIPSSLASLREVFIGCLANMQSGDKAEHTFEQVGRALAAIHRDLQVSTCSTWVPPPGLSLEAGERVFLHGDFGFSNVLLNQDYLDNNGDLELWIIDSSPNYFMTFETNATGPAEVDLANLVACMHGLFPLRRQIACDWRRSGSLLRHLIRGYESVANRDVDEVLLARLAELTLVAYMEHRLEAPIARRMALRLLLSKKRTTSLYKGAA